MTSPRHREVSAQRPWRATHTRSFGLVAVAALLASFVVGRGLLGGGADGDTTARFSGMVTRFADGGAVMCVRRAHGSRAVFCDVYYVRPGAPRIRVGDSVAVTTISSRAQDGAPMSGMLVAPLP